MAYGETQILADNPPAPSLYDNKATKLGWTAGGGVEVMLGPRWSAKAEYLYVDLGTNSVILPTFGVRSDFTFHVIRGGVNARF